MIRSDEIRSDEKRKGRLGAAVLILGALVVAGASLSVAAPANQHARGVRDTGAEDEKDYRTLGCTVEDNNTGHILRKDAHQDALFQTLMRQKFCPQTALAFRALLQQEGLALNPAMVANRGFHNPLPAGSFSFFEAVTGDFKGNPGGDSAAPATQKLDFGDFFFGHFTAAAIDNTALTSILAPQQDATPNNLLLESVVWDPRKQMFNFYEIRGNGNGGTWFYRGDSRDILMDITNVHRNTNPSQLLFGEVSLGGARLRCSGCHMNGGPIMKELAPPHDSWWTTDRPLDLGGMRVAPELQPILSAVVDASQFSGWVVKGNDKLVRSQPYWYERSRRSLQEQLRPLFCEQEVNLDSDLQPYESLNPMTTAPAGLFVNQCLLTPTIGDCLKTATARVEVPKGLYRQSLQNFDSLFLDYQAGGARPTDSLDADHAFETPVKSHTDMRLVARMIEDGMIDEEFAVDVLALDITRPMFSSERCGLLLLVPNRPVEASWRTQFESNLEASRRPGAKELLANLRDPQRNADYHREQAQEIVQKVRFNARQLGNAVDGYVRLLAERRIAVFNNQISQHPQGQIFEPDFRLIFPTMQLLKKNQNEIAYGGVPGQFWLNPVNGLVELAP